ncbi:MAG: serpin family protein [Thermoleophilia bacterium]
MPARGPALALLAVALFAPGCDGGGGPIGIGASKEPAGVQLVSSQRLRESPQVPAGDVAEAVAGNTSFAFDLFHLLAASEGTSASAPAAGDATPSGSVTAGNLVFSPYSTSTAIALALAYAGARGETAREMAATMHFTLELLATQYGAGMRLVDFAADAEAARRAINEWVAGRTGRRILDLLPPGSLDAITALALTNALYLSAPWHTPFFAAATQEGDFHLLDGGTVRASFMHQTTELAYGEGGGWQAAEIPYRGRQLAMLVIVPDEGRFAEVSAGLDAAGLDAVLRLLTPQEVFLTLPKFEITTNRSLRDALEPLGMTQAFEMGSADFSGMDGTRSLFVSGVQHQGFVAVDEAGTVAAAATVATMAAGAYVEPPELRADRPFVWLVRDVETGAVLFLGQVVDPSG